ncbi:MAG: peptidoglycan -binding protein [Desulfotignum sp.]|nr:peptidoglycan -binding protein [Desulfotignum sp.]MCF8112594.1 peptidoglycan -binding protein [Desulfotignum sp.]MCF8124934.1 peptidoglycan -binding protein [Desulfotignum sp.]
MLSRTRRNASPITAWPGYVDVLSALLMVVIFVLMIFVVAQFLLSEVLHGQKSELARLHTQVNELAEMLGLERQKSDRLETQVARLSDTIIALSEDREVLMSQVADYSEQTQADQEKLKQQMLTIASLNEDISALKQVKEKLEQQVGDLAAALEGRDRELGILRDRSKRLAARLADKTETTLLAQEKIEEQDIRIQALSAVLASQKKAIEKEQQLSASARAEVAMLSEQISRLRDQLEIIKTALTQAKEAGEKKDEKIEDLGRQLNIALARKVHELTQYRSEFFGRLKQILGDNQDIQIRGDRFVFQAELLFASGSADLGEAGKTRLTTLADTLLEVSRKIPEDINWILRIDGHSDKIPIHNEFFASNWELSTARALSVVRFLSRQGIPENRMAAAGFSKYHPIDPADTREAYQKNRRIEIKLTNY